jgi:3-hydroxybutyryl-CoA dehydrogenase
MVIEAVSAGGMNLETVGVIGAGVMGIGVAQVLAQAKYQVILVDVTDDVLARARQEIRQGVRFHHMLRRDLDLKPLDADEAVAHVTFTTEMQALQEADFVIENVTEKWAVKQPVYAKLDAICPPHCLFAANTSAIPITQIGAATQRQAQVLGIHFMNPVPLKDSVEVIRGYHTSEETLQTGLQLLESMGKRGIVVNDSPGFVSNRVLMLMINEAIFLSHEKVAAPETVDEIFTQCFGHKMGPLATADLIGLDTILLSLEVLYEQFQDPKFRPCPLLRQMVHAGLYGRKSGQGFFTYSS